MKIGNIAKPNAKGQIVIPKEFRKVLGIDKNVLLNLVLRGGGIYLYPIFEVAPKIDGENSYLKVLEKTRGKWSENWQALAKEKRAIELSASVKRKKEAW